MTYIHNLQYMSPKLISFIFVGTFVIINLFIAVVLNNLEQAKMEELATLRQPVSRDELLKELAVTQYALAQFRERMGELLYFLS